jgi:signal transduction histidine kinase
VTAYPRHVLQRAYAWMRGHPVAADGMLGAMLLAASAVQLHLGDAETALAAVLVNVLLALAVAVRRRKPATAFGVAAVVGLAQAGLGFRPGGDPVRALQPTVTDAAIVVLLYTLAAYRPRRMSLTGLWVCLAGSSIAIAGWSYAYRSATMLALAVVALGATFIAAWVAGDSAAYRRAYYASLEERLAAAERERDLEEKRARAVEESAARLRRIERDLHDGAQVRLTALAMTLGEVRESLAARGASVQPPDDVPALIAAAHQAAKETLAELRDLARGIHPPALDRGLEPALRGLAGCGVLPVRLDIGLAGRPSPAIEAMVYFSAAELLANAAKHSGASLVTITVRDDDGCVRLAVADDGAGGARLVAAGGLAGLRERIRTVDGRLGIDSPPGGPTVVTIELPGHA